MRPGVVAVGITIGVAAAVVAVAAPVVPHHFEPVALQPAPTRPMEPRGPAWLGQPRFALPQHLIPVAAVDTLKPRPSPIPLRWDPEQPVRVHRSHMKGRHTRHDDDSESRDRRERDHERDGDHRDGHHGHGEGHGENHHHGNGGSHGDNHDGGHEGHGGNHGGHEGGHGDNHGGHEGGHGNHDGGDHR